MLTYAVVTAARNEAANLSRLADCLLTQDVMPAEWIIVDDDSTDDTSALGHALEARDGRVHVVALTGARSETRGAPVARAF